MCDRFSILDVELCWQNEVKAYTNCTSSRFHCFVCFVWSGISLQGMLDGAEVKCMSDELKHTEPLSESYRKFCKFFIIFSLSYSECQTIFISFKLTGLQYSLKLMHAQELLFYVRNPAASCRYLRIFNAKFRQMQELL